MRSMTEISLKREDRDRIEDVFFLFRLQYWHVNTVHLHYAKQVHLFQPFVNVVTGDWVYKC